MDRKIIWQVDSLVSDESLEQLIWLKESGKVNCDISVVEKIPDKLPENVFIYGTIDFLKYGISRVPVYFNNEFRMSKMVDNHRDYCLNFGAVWSVKSALRYWTGHNSLFIKPDLCINTFEAKVYERDEFEAKMIMLKSATKINNVTQIFSSFPKNILREWRCLVINNKIVAGSRYLTDGNLDVVPNEIPDVDHLAALWKPDNVCMMDVALTENNEYKIIEYNSVHASDWYGMDMTCMEKILDQYYNDIDKFKESSCLKS